MAEHAMPAGIKREAKGVYVTLDGKIEIRQGEGGWRLRHREEPDRFTLEPFKNRGLAVAWLAEQGLLPTEAPKPEAPKVEQPTVEQPTVEQPEKPTRPTGRRPRQKAAASA